MVGHRCPQGNIVTAEMGNIIALNLWNSHDDDCDNSRAVNNDNGDDEAHT